MLRKPSGQIMPFLLVIIAIFLGAYFTTFQIGGQAINMTCADNAADACSLAAASYMARSLNTIHKEMGKQKKQFDIFQNYVKNQAKIIRNKLVAAKKNITQAKAKLNSAKASAAPGAFCSVWNSAQDASTMFTQAADLIQEAKNSITQAVTQANYLKQGVKEYKKSTHDDFCGDIKKMNKFRDDAKKNAISYAFQNNCVFPTLSPSEQAGINNQTNGLPQQNNNPHADLNYGWTDSGGHSRSMSADVTLPQISAYELEVTKMNEPCGPQNMPGALSSGAKDPYGIASYNLLGSLLEPIAGKLRDSSATEAIIYAGTLAATSSPCAPFSCPTGRCCSEDFPTLTGQANTVIAQIDASLNDLDTASAAIESLIQYTKGIVKDLDPKPGKRIVPTFNCADSGDVIIIAIDDIKFESGCIKCNVNMQDAGVPSASGTSTSAFGGGSLHTSQPNKHYIPKVTDNSCPNHGGVTTGFTMGPNNHTDGGCN